jgi:hypothetical protein
VPCVYVLQAVLGIGLCSVDKMMGKAIRATTRLRCIIDLLFVFIFASVVQCACHACHANTCHGRTCLFFQLLNPCMLLKVCVIDFLALSVPCMWVSAEPSAHVHLWDFNRFSFHRICILCAALFIQHGVVSAGFHVFAGLGQALSWLRVWLAHTRCGKIILRPAYDLA